MYSQDKREPMMMKIYIIRALDATGRRIDCENCHTRKKLTFQHDKYGKVTIDDIRILCWKCHSIEDTGTARSDTWMKGVWVDSKNYVHVVGTKFALSHPINA